MGISDTSDISVNVYQNEKWSNPNQMLSPGEGAVVYSQSESFVVSAVGTVLEGNLMNYVPAGSSLHSSMAPFNGLLSTSLRLRPSPGDSVIKFQGDLLETFTFTEQGWSPSEPSARFNESFLIRAKSPFVWSYLFDLEYGLR